MFASFEIGIVTIFPNKPVFFADRQRVYVPSFSSPAPQSFENELY
jgi:hypothetical protein